MHRRSRPLFPETIGFTRPPAEGNARRNAAHNGEFTASLRFVRRHLALLLLVAIAAVAAPAVAFAAPPAEASLAVMLRDALGSFRTEGPKGWSFTQTTVGAGHSRVERYDAAQPDFARWTLLTVDGRAPTDDERREYHDKLSRRSRGGTAPQLASQLDLQSMEVVADETERATARFRLNPGEADDITARFLRATVVFHKPSRTIESLELSSTGPFSPALGVRIVEMNTTLRYSLPEGDRPGLLQHSFTRLRGRAFFLKSLDADLTVTFTDYEKARPRQRSPE